MRKPLNEEQKAKKRLYDKQFYEANRNNLKEKRKDYLLKTSESTKKVKKIWYEQNKKNVISHQNNYKKNKRETDNLFKLTENIRGLITSSFKNKSFNKKIKTEQILGCSFSDFLKHLESKFESWMDWDNKGKYNGQFNYGWDIDHIIPLSSAKTEEDVIRLNHYTNLQPLCSHTNRNIKKDK